MVALITIPWLSMTYSCSTSDYVCRVVYYILTGVGITMGFHSLWAHKTYKSYKKVSYSLLLFGTAALQNSVNQRYSDHRKHNKVVDDPINYPSTATRGFWISHFG
ncbi:hypothetical protein IFN73_09935 [Francisella tularensis subsp. holarctica]|nr:hypothetical protein [Francisella tularensis subsp. holarctica]